MRCLFCEFASKKRKKHINGLPFEPLHQTKNTLSFLSVDFPAKEDGHILVIPKKHYAGIEDIPKQTLNELIQHVVFLTKVTRKSHESCNLLLNDGRSAEQHVLHAHFHIIPRDKNDEIKVKKWKSKRLSSAKFKALNKKIKNSIKNFK